MPLDRGLLPPLLEMLGPSSRESMLSAAQTVRLPKGAVIFRTGDESGGLYEVVEGKVKLSRYAEDAPTRRPRDEAVMLLTGPGHLFGEIAVFDGGRRIATATTITPVVLRHYPPEVLDSLIRSSVDIGYAILRHVSYRLRFTLERNHDLSRYDRSARVARTILRLGERFGTYEDGVLVVRHDLTQGELGSLTGVSRETASKVLTELTSRGLLRSSTGCIEVLDEDGLSRVAENNS